MIFWATAKDTGLSQDYHVETFVLPSGEGVRAIFRTRDGFIVGSFVNPRTRVGDTRPMETVVVIDARAMAEILEHWSKS